MEYTIEMKERAECLGADWTDEGDGYYSLFGNTGFVRVCYIAIPTTHRLVGTEYDELDVDVNGGLTFSKGNVFGWDYEHITNDHNYTQHIKNAIEFFKEEGRYKIVVVATDDEYDEVYYEKVLVEDD